MLYIKDGNILNKGQIQSLHPNLSFAASTLEELGWAPYAPPPQVETQEELVQRLTNTVQAHLDKTARERNYDSILSACSYAAAPNPFQVEGLAFLNWRSSVWSTCYQILADVQANTRSIPEDIVSELPGLTGV